jgi:hypothetical protein
MKENMMTTKFVLRKSMVILAIALALGGSALPINAFAAGGVSEGGRIVNDANAHRSERLRHGHERGYAWRPQGRSEWDPWGHWGGYYGPMVGGIF